MSACLVPPLWLARGESLVLMLAKAVILFLSVFLVDRVWVRLHLYHVILDENLYAVHVPRSALEKKSSMWSFE